MKKWVGLASSVFLTVGLLAACGGEEGSSSSTTKKEEDRTL